MAIRRRRAEAPRHPVVFLEEAKNEFLNVPAFYRGPIAAHLRKISKEGCRVAGYALSGDEPWPRICSKHFGEEWRVLVTFLDDGRVVVIAVEQHNVRNDPYVNTAQALDLRVSTAPRKKPPCCVDGVPALMARARLEELGLAFARLKDIG